AALLDADAQPLDLARTHQLVDAPDRGGGECHRVLAWNTEHAWSSLGRAWPPSTRNVWEAPTDLKQGRAGEPEKRKGDRWRRSHPGTRECRDVSSPFCASSRTDPCRSH